MCSSVRTCSRCRVPGAGLILSSGPIQEQPCSVGLCGEDTESVGARDADVRFVYLEQQIFRCRTDEMKEFSP